MVETTRLDYRDRYQVNHINHIRNQRPSITHDFINMQHWIVTKMWLAVNYLVIMVLCKLSKPFSLPCKSSIFSSLFLATIDTSHTWTRNLAWIIYRSRIFFCRRYVLTMTFELFQSPMAILDKRERAKQKQRILLPNHQDFRPSSEHILLFHVGYCFVFFIRKVMYSAYIRCVLHIRR